MHFKRNLPGTKSEKLWDWQINEIIKVNGIKLQLEDNYAGLQTHVVMT